MYRIRALIRFDIKSMLLTMYLTAVWIAYIVVFVTDKVSDLILLIICVGICTYVVSHVILNVVKKMDFNPINERCFKHKVTMFVLCTVICFICMMIWYIGYNPGAFSPDSIAQYKQVISGNYNDWHPVWHTLIFFALPLTLTGRIESIVLFQMVCFSFSIGYMSMVIYKYMGKWKSFIAVAFILLNPYTGCILLYPWKDVGFAIVGLLSMAMMVEVYLSDGEWLYGWWKYILLGAALANMILFRHNGILFSAFALVGLLFNLNKIKWLRVAVVMAAFLITVKGPVYRILNVEEPDSRISESVGLPLTVIGNVMKENPVAMDEEMLDFAYSIAPYELWQKQYVCGNFNAIKFAGGDLTVVNESSIGEIMRITVKCFIYAPKASFRAFFALTDMVYGLENGMEGYVYPEIIQNDYGIQYKGNENVYGFLESYRSLMTRTSFRYISSIGFTILIMIVVMLGKNSLRKREDQKKILLCIPILTYNFGTMLLLTGPDSRFFYISYLVCPLVVCLAVRRKENE